VEVTHPDRVLFPGEGITKADVVEYYRRVAPVMVPHVRNRPLMLERYRDGIDHGPKAGGVVDHPVVDSEDGLVNLANQGCLTFHCWTARADRPRRPDRLVFDLDPPDGAFATVRATAPRLRRLLERLGLTAFVQTTGSRGLHVVAPIIPGPDNDEVLAFARAVAEVLAASDRAQLTTEFRKAERGGRVYLDVARNAYAQTVVAPYSVRARPGAPVATPLDWDEVRTTRLRPDRWTVTNIFRRLGAKADPWRGIARCARPLPEAWARLESLTASRAS